MKVQNVITVYEFDGQVSGFIDNFTISKDGKEIKIFNETEADGQTIIDGINKIQLN